MKIRVAFVCWGNICRSTLSESVFTYKVKEKGSVYFSEDAVGVEPSIV